LEFIIAKNVSRISYILHEINQHLPALRLAQTFEKSGGRFSSTAVIASRASAE
jgi:hypothetical protein